MGLISLGWILIGDLGCLLVFLFSSLHFVAVLVDMYWLRKRVGIREKRDLKILEGLIMRFSIFLAREIILFYVDDRSTLPSALCDLSLLI